MQEDLEETISTTRTFCTLRVLYKSWPSLTGLMQWMEIKLQHVSLILGLAFCLGQGTLVALF
jgi:hypothetical protein